MTITCTPSNDPWRPKELRLIARQMAIINFRFLAEFAGTWLFDEPRRPPSEFGRQFDFTPESRNRKPAMSFAKVGSLVFGPELPDGKGEAIYRIASRRGKKQTLICVRDGRDEFATRVGHSYQWHADNNIAVFGRAKRGELVKLRNRLGVS